MLLPYLRNELWKLFDRERSDAGDRELAMDIIDWFVDYAPTLVGEAF